MTDDRILAMVVLGSLLAVSGCDREPVDHERASETSPCSTRPIRLEDPDDVHRRAVIAIEQRIARVPEDAAFREALIRWKEDQILLDDMAESDPLDRDYALGRDYAFGWDDALGREGAR